MRIATHSKFSRPGLRFLFPAVAAAWLAAPTVCHATPINYVLSPSASATFSDGTEAISGSFTADATTAAQSNVSITFTSTLPTSEEGTYTTNNTILGYNNTLVTAYDASTDNFIALEFSSPLDISPDSITNISFSASGALSIPASAVSGSAVFGPSAVPEPSALALLGTALAGLFLASVRANQRDRQLHSRQPGTA
jgi:hypothetical protein